MRNLSKPHDLIVRLCCTDYFEMRKFIMMISLCRGLEETQDKLRLTNHIASL